LRNKLEAIEDLGFVPSQRKGPTGVGFTLESLLGIQANSKRTPDYKGIELKSGRATSKSNLSTLFSKKPDWARSAMSAKTTLDTFGYTREGRLQLYCTIGPAPNSLGLFSLTTDTSDDYEVHGAASGMPPTPVNTWAVTTLEQRLNEKHPETFWIEARVQTTAAGVEEFHYVRATHTRRPLTINLRPLLEVGKVTLDFTMSEKNGRVRDHGYLFRMKPVDRPLLFPSPQVYDL
jgi:hypothetical protein